MPLEVAIDEAVQLAKRYSSEDAGRLVNGILGELQRRHTVSTPASPSPSRASQELLERLEGPARGSGDGGPRAGGRDAREMAELAKEVQAEIERARRGGAA